MRASLRDLAAPSRHGQSRATHLRTMAVVLGGLAALTLAGAVYAAGTAPAAKSKSATASAKSAATPRTATPATPVATAKPVAGVRAAAVSATPSTVGPARTTGKAVTVQTTPPIDERVTYQYNALGRRDPFVPMVGGIFIGDDIGGDAPPDVGGIKVVGIIWGASDKFALVEDARGNSSVLRTGDKVQNGVVETLQRDAVVVKLTVDGQTETVAIPLTRKGDQNNASR